MKILEDFPVQQTVVDDRGSVHLNVALLTDFGWEDIYPGVMKGVIASVNPAVNIIDLTHSVLPQNIIQGAFLLYSSCRYFPAGTVFCTVVDPTVGSNRRAIAVKTKDYCFVGPDNGVMAPAALDNSILEIVELSNSEFFPDSVSSTFHGRDIFAPACAHIASGTDIARMGNAVEDMVQLDFGRFDPSRPVHEVRVLHVDTFGNIILDIPAKDFQRAGKPPVQVNSIIISRTVSHYAEADPDEPVFLTSSSGFAEIALKNADAARKLELAPGDTVSLSFLGKGSD